MISTSDSSSSPPGSLRTRHGRCGWLIDGADGPDASPPAADIDLTRLLTAGEGTRFRLGEAAATYAEGRYLGPDALRHAPLTHYGYGWLGATWIAYETGTGWERLRVPLRAIWHVRRTYPRYWLRQNRRRLIRTLRGAAR